MALQSLKLSSDRSSSTPISNETKEDNDLLSAPLLSATAVDPKAQNAAPKESPDDKLCLEESMRLLSVQDKL